LKKSYLKIKVVAQVIISSKIELVKYFFLLVTYDISTDSINSILSITGLNRFRVQIRLLHSEGFPTQSSIKYYNNCAIWESEDFTEGKSDILSQYITNKNN
jgi:hypothetical protein